MRVYNSIMMPLEVEVVKMAERSKSLVGISKVNFEKKNLFEFVAKSLTKQ